MSNTAVALVGFAGWFILLTLVLAIYRSSLVLGGRRAANAFATDGSDLPGLGARLTRARDNCFETLPLFAALALAAQLAGRLDVTDGLALWVLALRLAQSLVHIASTSVNAVLVRANLFFAQMLIYLWWVIRLFGAGA
ncbi:MAG: MAPEG family protein [Deltaproteobacteria bacterium]|nr:MAPEG family protein [Deltaproteobacteria bacterium]